VVPKLIDIHGAKIALLPTGGLTVAPTADFAPVRLHDITVNFSSRPWPAGTAMSDAMLATQNFLKESAALADGIGLSGPPVSSVCHARTHRRALTWAFT
jgi:hypothetical protein